MATRTTYTTTITVPVYASWRCQHCEEVNFSTGIIRCQKAESTTSFRNSKHKEAKIKASSLAQAEWASHAYKIISDPNNNAQAMRSDFQLQNTCCTKCGKKPKWDKNMRYLTWAILCFIPTIISGLVLLGPDASVGAWLVFLTFLAIIVTAAISEPRYKKMMKYLPREYTPVIGSLNGELIEYAEHLGKIIPTIDETIEIAKGTQMRKQSYNTSVSSATISISSSDIKREVCFCRKCGVQLQADSRFCHKCGTEIIISRVVK